MNIYSVYAIRIGNQSYVGLTAYPVSRQTEHERLLQQGKHYNKSMQTAYNDHGSYEWIVLESNLSKRIGMEKERHWIAELDTIANGFNTHRSNNSYRGSFLARLCTWIAEN